jgi:tryptophan synthase beta chain
MNLTKVNLEEHEMPTSYYNIQADMPNPLQPSLHPGTGEPLGPQDLSAIFPMELIKQEVTQERYIEIPEPVFNFYKTYRSTPVIRAYNLEKALNTPAKIYYKYEGASPAGSHKLNTALPQAYYNKMEGVEKLCTETGAGQWGTALAFACKYFDLTCRIFMVKVSYNQKPYRKMMMQAYGAEVFASPSEITKTGREILANDPNCPGSLGIAISEAVEEAVQDEKTKYALGSVLNHVILHQTIIGQEAKLQMEKFGDYPDIVIGCHGGGTNFGGIAFPFVKDKIEGKKIRAIAAEPASCPTLTKGVFAYDFGDVSKMTPLMPMYTLGHNFIPPSIHAGGLRYHGASPLVSQLLKDKLIEAQAFTQKDIFSAALLFSKTEGIIPAPESSHAIRCAINEAEKCKEEGTAKTILFNLSGHGFLDMSSYEKYFSNQLEDFDYPEENIHAALKELEKYPKVK